MFGCCVGPLTIAPAGTPFLYARDDAAIMDEGDVGPHAGRIAYTDGVHRAVEVPQPDAILVVGDALADAPPARPVTEDMVTPGHARALAETPRASRLDPQADGFGGRPVGAEDVQGRGQGDEVICAVELQRVTGAIGARGNPPETVSSTTTATIVQARMILRMMRTLSQVNRLICAIA